MEYFSKISNPPHVRNLRINPGLRHRSRLYTKPKSFVPDPDPYPDAQIKIVYNYFGINPQGSIILIGTKNLFSRQLPNMGTTYISRLLFDIKAFSIVLLHGGCVHGGICSRIFEKESFIEIAFCAVDYQFQARGYGRLLMNYLKSCLQNINIYDMITCADNEAVTYFRKQGFNQNEILMNPSRWVGCIKDYDGITLVHCRLRSDIVYSKFPKILQKQIEILRSKTHFVHDLPNVTPSFVPFFQSPSFANFSLSSLPPSLFKAENYSERMKVLKEKLLRIFNTLASDNKFAEVFEHPVTEDFAPGYFSKIKKPMDFMTIRKRLTKYEDYYKRPEIFAADITLMCDNCKLFNTPDTSYYRLANELMKKFNHLYFEEFPQ